MKTSDRDKIPSQDYEVIPRSLATVDRIKEAASRANLDYWTRDHSEKPNLPQNVFSAVVALMPYTVAFNRPKRTSSQGTHGDDGEDYVFMAEFQVEYMGIKKRFFIKGYFFRKGHPVGMTIQSFRSIEV